jgi:hypothetical protein
MDDNDLDHIGLTTSEALTKLGATELDPNDPWDSPLLAEAALLKTWAGVSATVAHHTGGTAARSDGLVTVNKSQLNRFFGKFPVDQYETAIFFALAHEFGHLCQFKYFGAKKMKTLPRINLEAHADVLAGVWLAVRIALAQPHTSEAAYKAGFQLKSNSSNYPSHRQRGYLVQKGIAHTAMLISVEHRFVGDDYKSITDSLDEQDVTDLYTSAVKGLDEYG